MSHEIDHSRWYVKKVARKALATSAWASGYLAARDRAAAEPRVRVLTYHRFGDSPYDPFCVSRRDFAEQMRFLADEELAISLYELEEFLRGERDLRDGSVLVTSDDGFRSVYTDMLPVLIEYGIPAVAFVTAGLIDGQPRPTPWRGPPVDPQDAYLNWDELSRLAESHVAIGSHGWSHRSLGELSPAECHDEALRSRETLEGRLGRAVTSIAYPYGTLADFSHATGQILADCGYTTAFTSQHGAIDRNADAVSLPRVKVEGGEALWMFRLICRGAMDPWRLVDESLSRMQRSGR